MAIVTWTGLIQYLIDKAPDMGVALFTGFGALYMLRTWRSGEKMFDLNKKKSF